ncbi:MAG: FAD-binding protein [Bacteroidales bacterium]|nr:FAD-binding protein [Bacteroidales bacterium]
MNRTVQIDLTPEQLADQAAVRRAAGAAVGEDVKILRRSIDCRRRQVVYHLMVEVGAKLEGPSSYRVSSLPSNSPQVVVVGAGPAGLFAALRAIELGIRPVIVERGKPVDQRRKDIASLARNGVVDPDSNWCFGEGGAGTFSDGKLYTRSTKRGDVGAVLQQFVNHGADPDIMVDVHAHIGTDRLGGIIANMRATIEAAGGEYHFNSKVVDFVVNDGRVIGVVTADGAQYEGAAVILATGHSARDIYHMFNDRGWLLEPKPFALGVRVEHPQELINQLQYHGSGYSSLLPPAAYSLTAQAAGHGVFSFCMCPGGVIVPAATAAGEQVVNGMSNSHRNSPFANSGIAVTVGLEDIASSSDSPLALLDFQQKVEQAVFHAAGDRIAAPAQRLVDFLHRRESRALPRSGYLGQTVQHPLHELLPGFVVDSLAEGFKAFDRKMRGFVSQDALLLAVESRTSSPVRIPRDKETLQHPQLQGLYPCGEGAGYAGGIVSSAIDGIRCMEQVYAILGSLCSRK